MDNLGEIAFGESALNRPVTRAAVDDMLEERSRLLANVQQQKTVDNYLADQQKLKENQGEENDFLVDKQIAPSSIEVVALEQKSAIGEDVRTPSAPDQLFFLSDRWSKQRKAFHLTVFCLWIFALQCLDVGYNIALPFIATSLLHSQISASMQTGRLAFLVGEATGLLVGVSFSSWGRLRVSLLAIVAQGSVCVALGFIQSSVVLTIVRGLSGLMAGIFEIVAIGVVLDLMTSRQHRAFGLGSLLCFAVAGQIAGPWIAQLILSLIHWSWLYWIMSIFTVVYIFFFVFTIRETEPLTIYRANVTIFERQKDKIRTPELRILPGFTDIIRYHMIQPYLVPFIHGGIIMSGLVLAFSLGSLVLAFEGLGAVLVDRHHMTSLLAKITITVSIAIATLSAIFVLALLPARGSSPFYSKGRRRSLFIVEKGLIDASRPAHDAEDLLRPAIGAIILDIVCECEKE